MIRIVANDDYVPDYNFGYPCILHGVEEILREMYGEDGYTLTVYSHSQFRAETVKDYSCEIRYMESVPKRLLLTSLLRKIGIRTGDAQMNGIVDEIVNADLVAGLYPITFCSSFNTSKTNRLLSVLKMTLGQNLILTIGKLFGKRTVKTVCSIGPFYKESDAKGAKLASRYLWDKIYVREKRSAAELAPYLPSGKKAVVAPDLANVMGFTGKEGRGEKPVGISVSFQIINQWKGGNNYIDCIADLCAHILRRTQSPVLLIPNEYTPGLPFSDIDVAGQILEKVTGEGKTDTDRVRLLHITEITCRELKNEIASCEVLIASRYHSCVAGLSAGVPTLVVGWHWKYEELLKLYGQEAWGIPTDLCEPGYLTEKFDEFWGERNDIRKVLREKGQEVYEECMKYGREMFTV